MKITAHELSELRGLIYEASQAKDAPTKILQHRRMFDRLKLCLSFLEQPHPNDDRLRFALFTLFDSVRFDNGRVLVINQKNYHWAMQSLFEIMGYMKSE